MHPGIHARTRPDHPALIMGTSGRVVTYRELDERSCRVAQLLWDAGLRPGDHLAMLLENRPEFLEIAWAGLRSGLYVTAISTHLVAAETAYIVNDCEATAVFASPATGDVAAAIIGDTPDVVVRLAVGGPVVGHADYEEAVAKFPPVALAHEPLGDFMLYSSGTTGQPKGVKRPLSGRMAAEGNAMLVPSMPARYGIGPSSVYLSPAPMYHAAPFNYSAAVQAWGGTVVMMEKFDAEHALQLIERYHVTEGQFVPTMFLRMLKLPDAVRFGYDVSSLRTAIHAAAPCPVAVKQQMIDWWGPILFEYYAGTEGNGVTHITSAEWLEHRGSVGIPAGPPLHICDDEGVELPVGEEGLVYFESLSGALPFEYHNDTAKTAGTVNPAHPAWSTLGDVGRVDADGYLYLTDRKAFLIISGGVNIYPQEIENVLVMHPKVTDVAVFGIPDAEFGEQVKAVVQPADTSVVGDTAGEAALEQELLEYCRTNLAHLKCPRTIDFTVELPRMQTGKLYKRALREPYWAGRDTRIGT